MTTDTNDDGEDPTGRGWLLFDHGRMDVLRQQIESAAFGRSGGGACARETRGRVAGRLAKLRGRYLDGVGHKFSCRASRGRQIVKGQGYGETTNSCGGQWIYHRAAAN
jgi:hypothetical protein